MAYRRLCGISVAQIQQMIIHFFLWTWDRESCFVECKEVECVMMDYICIYVHVCVKGIGVMY